MLAQPVAFPVPQVIVEAAGAEWAQPQTVACSGPYVLTELNASQVILRKNPLWHTASQVQIEEIRFLRIADEELAFNAFLAGELDSVRVPQSRLEEAQATPELSGLLHRAADESFWLTRPWLSRAYPVSGEELIYQWRLDGSAKRAARQRM
jgi:ABC-type oligopeptide transport system substrate-binding subunit